MCVIDWTIVSIVTATVAGPILAVYASDLRTQHRRTYENKEKVFHVLMATRGARMQLEHVAALNRIELAFPRSKHPNVVDTWELYLKHLGDDQGQSQEKEIFDRWSEKANDLFHDMLQAMASDLKIPFSRTSIKYNAYYPIGYSKVENENHELRKLLLELLRNERFLNMNAVVYQPLAMKTESETHNQEKTPD